MKVSTVGGRPNLNARFCPVDVTASVYKLCPRDMKATRLIANNALGSLSSLKNQKKDVTEMRKGTECGLGFDNFEAFEVGDQVQCYEVITEKRRLG